MFELEVNGQKYICKWTYGKVYVGDVLIGITETYVGAQWLAQKYIEDDLELQRLLATD
jgi:hypothetical protein